MDARVSNQVLWILTNPFSGSPQHPNRSSKELPSIIGYTISHHVIGGTGQFVTQGFGGHCSIGFSLFLLVESLGFLRFHDGKVGSFHIGPG